MDDFLKRIINRLQQPITVDKPKIIAISILASLFLILFLGVFAPLIDATSEARGRAEDMEFRLTRLKKIAAEKPRLMGLRQSLKESRQTDETFFPTETASLASADLQSHIKQSVTAAEGELISTQVIPEQTEDRFIRIGVKVRMNGSSPILKNVLYNFETAKPYLFIENLNIRPIRLPHLPGSKETSSPDKLSIDFDVIGYMRAP